MKKTKEKRKVGLGGEGSSEWGSEVRDKNGKKEKKRQFLAFFLCVFHLSSCSTLLLYLFFT